MIGAHEAHRPHIFPLLGVAAGITLALIGAMVILPHPGLAFLPFLLIAAAAFVLRAPGVVFAAYLYIPFYKGVVDPYLPVDLTALLAVACLLTALPVFLWIFRGEALGATILWTSLAGVIIVGTMHAISPDVALPKLAGFLFLIYLPLFLGMRVARDRALIEQFLVATLALSGIVTAAGLVQLTGLGPTERVAAMSDTIGTGRSALLLPLLVPLAFRILPRWIALGSLAVAPFSLLVAVSSGSRGPLLMAVLTIVIMQVLIGRRLALKAILGVIGIAAGVMLLQLPQVQALLPREAILRFQILLRAALGSGELDDGSSIRLDLYQTAITMLGERPLLGYGTAGFEVLARRVSNLDILTYPHNMLLEMGADFGSIGLFVTLALVITAFVRGVSCIRDMHCRAIVLIAMFAFLNAMVSGSLYDSRWLWGMLVMLLALKAGQKDGDAVVSKAKGRA